MKDCKFRTPCGWCTRKEMDCVLLSSLHNKVKMKEPKINDDWKHIDYVLNESKLILKDAVLGNSEDRNNLKDCVSGKNKDNMRGNLK